MTRIISHLAAAMAGGFAMIAVFAFYLGFETKGWQAVGFCAVAVAFMAATMPRATR